MSRNIILYTDGSAKGNPGKGGYGIILISGKHRKELSSGYRLTTNNRMELMGVIVGLEALKFPSCQVTVYTDSKYVVDAVVSKMDEVLARVRNKEHYKKMYTSYQTFLNDVIFNYSDGI